MVNKYDQLFLTEFKEPSPARTSVIPRRISVVDARYRAPI